MQIAVDVHLMGGKITADEEIGTLLAIGNEQFIAHITVTVVVSRLMANEDVAGAVVFRPGPKPKSGIPLTGRIVPEGPCTQPGVISATGVLPQRMVTNGSIPIASVVFFKRSSPNSGVFFSFVIEEGFVTAGGVGTARGVAGESTGAIGSIAPIIPATLLYIGFLLPLLWSYDFLLPNILDYIFIEYELDQDLYTQSTESLYAK